MSIRRSLKHKGCQKTILENTLTDVRHFKNVTCVYFPFIFKYATKVIIDLYIYNFLDKLLYM